MKKGDTFEIVVQRPREPIVREQVTVIRPVKLLGVGGFALHRAVGGVSYAVSHVETGRLVAYGYNERAAVANASVVMKRAGGVAALHRAIERHKVTA